MHLPPNTNHADSGCNAGCAGDPSQICGGSWRLSTYSEHNNVNHYFIIYFVRNQHFIVNSGTTMIPQPMWVGMSSKPSTTSSACDSDLGTCSGLLQWGDRATVRWTQQEHTDWYTLI